MDNSQNPAGRERRFAELTRTGPNVILITDAAGRLERAWGTTERLFGVGAEALSGRTLRELIDPAHWEAFDEYFAACRKEPRTRRYLDVHTAPPSQTWCELETFNNRHDDPTHLELAFRLRDVTARYAARDLLADEAARQRLGDQLNEVLSAIRTQTADIMRQLPSGDDSNASLDRIRASVAEIDRAVARAAKLTA